MGKKTKKVIMVDDDVTNLTIAKNVLIDKYDVFTAPSGKKLFQMLEKITPDLILLDIEMPEMNGFEVLKNLKDAEKTSEIPVIFLTAKIDPESEMKGLSFGAIDYITKPFSPQLLSKRIEVHLLVEEQKKELLKYAGNLEEIVNRKTKTVFELQNTILKTVAELVECRDNVTGGHIERTQRYLRLLVNHLLELGIYTRELSSWDIDLFIMSCQLHDVGKIYIKDSILMKPGELTYDEYEEMKKHTTYGLEIIQKIEESTSENAFLKYAEILAGSHHEKWDGTGYPLGLKYYDIPLQGRLMAIVDVYDALTNDRPYKKAFTHEKAVEIIKSGMGTHFDPLLVEVFLKYESEFKDIANIENITKISEYRSRQKVTQDLRSSVLNTVSNIIDIRTGSGESHVDRVSRYLEVFMNVLLKHDDYKEEISAWDIDIFVLMSQLHDIGKFGVKDSILNKTGKLTEAEFEEMKKHTTYGLEIIHKLEENTSENAFLKYAEILASSHHEKWDGSGYPLGLKGKGIPLQGRLMAIIDVYDALTKDRPHRGMLSHNEAVGIIKSCSGTQFDPELVKIFLEHETEFENVGVVNE